MTDQFERTPDLAGMPDAPPLCDYCGHSHEDHMVRLLRGVEACDRCNCSVFRQPPIPSDPGQDVEAPRTVPSSRLFAGAFEHLASSAQPVRVSLHTGEYAPPDYDRQAFETVSRNMAASIDTAAMERLTHPSQIVSTPAEESRKPIILRATAPVTDEEAQGLANRFRGQTTYPVIVVSHGWEVIA